MTTKIAIVTGSNKGIGYAVVRGLCKQFNGKVYLTARDEGRGREAVTKLEGEGHKACFHQLDITDQASIDRLAKYMKDNYGGIDILVNNAGMAYSNNSPAPRIEQAEVSIRTNFWGTVNVTKALMPLLRPGARVVHVSSMVSLWAWKKLSAENQAAFNKCKTTEEVGDHLQKFIEAARKDDVTGWASSNYGMSKVGVSLLSLIHQGQAEAISGDILVNACCPGYVDTDMSAHKGSLTIDQGAENPLKLALLPPNSDIRGKFMQKLQVFDWQN